MVVAVTVSMVAFLDSSVINLALPAIEHDLGGGLALQQWIIDGYLLAMAAAILRGGFSSSGGCHVTGDADHRARHPGPGCGVPRAGLAGADQHGVRQSTPVRG